MDKKTIFHFLQISKEERKKTKTMKSIGEDALRDEMLPIGHLISKVFPKEDASCLKCLLILQNLKKDDEAVS